MTTSLVVILAAAIGLVVNTIAILGVAWKGGHLLGRLQTVVETLSGEVTKLREWRHESAGLETRLEFLERQMDEVREGRLRPK